MGLARFDDLNWKSMMSRFPFVLWARIEELCKSRGDAFSDAPAALVSLAAFVIHQYRFKMITTKKTITSLQGAALVSALLLSVAASATPAASLQPTQADAAQIAAVSVTPHAEPIFSSQLLWPVSADHAFIVRIEPNATGIARSERATAALLDSASYDLRIYRAHISAQGIERGEQVYGEDGTGRGVGVWHTGELGSPLVVTTQTDGRYFFVRGFHAEQDAQGQWHVRRGVLRESTTMPEIVNQPEQGLYLLFTQIENKYSDTLLSSKVLFKNGQWQTLDETLPGESRLKGIVLTDDNRTP